MTLPQWQMHLVPPTPVSRHSRPGFAVRPRVGFIEALYDCVFENVSF